MSQQYDKTNKGVLFVNDRKESENQPDRKGSINIEGREYWLSAWNRNTAKGDTISLSVKPKESRPEQNTAQPAKTNSNFEDDPIPF